MVPRQPHSGRDNRLRLGKQIAIALAALPVAEFVAFVLMVMWIGFAAAFALMVVTSLAGAMVLRRVGRGGIAQFRGAVSEPGATGRVIEGGGLLVALGGILLVLPGFITDVVGTLLLLPFVHRWLGAAFRRASDGPGEPAGDDAVVDLAPGEWRQVDDPRIGKQSGEDRRPR
jgi:UPF0716 protein FxsA